MINPKQLYRKIKIPSKIIGWLFVALGLGVLAQPWLPTGLIADVGAMTGVLMMMAGLTIITGLPSVSKVWNEIEYGAYALIFIAGLSLLYMRYYGTADYWGLLLKYTIFGVVAGIVSVAMNVWLSE